MKPITTLALCLCLAACAAEQPAQPKAKAAPSEATRSEAPAKAYPLKTCIVSDNDLDSMGEQTSIVYQGQTIKFCCSSCIAKFEKNPAKYLKKLEGK